MSFTNQMGSLRNTLNDSKQRTSQAVKRVKRDANEIIRGAQALVAEYTQTQKVNAQQLRQDLERTTQSLSRQVKEMRGDNIRSQRELRRDFVSGHNVFWGKQKVEEKKKEEKEK